MTPKLTFKPGELDRQIGLMGLTLGEFASRAEVDGRTLAKARNGKRIRPLTWGKIVKALGQAS